MQAAAAGFALIALGGGLMVVGPETPTRAARAPGGPDGDRRQQLLARKDRLVEDVRILGVVLGTAFEGRLERVNERVEDYRHLLERRRAGAKEDSKRGSGHHPLPDRVAARRFPNRGRQPARSEASEGEETMSSQPLDPRTPHPRPRAAPPPLPPGPGDGAPYVRLPKSPGLAAFLSLFPGLGQVYNGRIARAFVFFFAWVGSIYLTASGHEFPFAFVIPFVYLFNIIDAWKGATAINARFLGGRSEPEEDDDVESPVWGGSLVAIGVLVLFSNLGWLDLDRLARWWPLLLIAVGAYFVYASVQKKKAEETADEPPRL